MEKTYKSVQPYRKEKIGGKLARKDEGRAKLINAGRYLLRRGITITTDKMARAADTSVKVARQRALPYDW